MNGLRALGAHLLSAAAVKPPAVPTKLLAMEIASNDVRGGAESWRACAIRVLTAGLKISAPGSRPPMMPQLPGQQFGVVRPPSHHLFFGKTLGDVITNPSRDRFTARPQVNSPAASSASSLLAQLNQQSEAYSKQHPLTILGRLHLRAIREAGNQVVNLESRKSETS